MCICTDVAFFSFKEVVWFSDDGTNMPRGVFPIFFSFVLGVVYEHLLSAGSRFIGLIIISITAMVRGEKKKTKPTTLRIFRKIGCDGRHVFLRSFFFTNGDWGGSRAAENREKEKQQQHLAPSSGQLLGGRPLLPRRVTSTASRAFAKDACGGQE